MKIVCHLSTNFVFIVVLSLSLAGCADPGAATNVDAWYTPPPPLSDGTTQRAVLWAEVKPSAIAEAEQRLSAADLVYISSDEIGRYTDPPLRPAAGDAPYLVRGLCLNRDTGRFTVTFDGHDLHVHNGSLGHKAVPMKRHPLLVALPNAPEHVYVTVSMAE